MTPKRNPEQWLIVEWHLATDSYSWSTNCHLMNRRVAFLLGVTRALLLVSAGDWWWCPCVILSGFPQMPTLLLSALQPVPVTIFSLVTNVSGQMSLAQFPMYSSDTIVTISGPLLFQGLLEVESGFPWVVSPRSRELPPPSPRRQLTSSRRTKNS